MAYQGSWIGICDNTGVLSVKLLQIYRHSQAIAGDIVVTVVKRRRKMRDVVKKKINLAFVVSQRQPIFRRRGFYYLFLRRNSCILLGSDNERILGTRHYGFLTLESRKTAFSELLRICRVII